MCKRKRKKWLTTTIYESLLIVDFKPNCPLAGPETIEPFSKDMFIEF